MMKVYTIKFYSQKNDSTKLVEYDSIEQYEYNKFQAFKVGRVQLANFAKNFINNYSGNYEDIRYFVARVNFDNLMSGQANYYSEDETTYFFKVFSKKETH
jgi:hypothetical protein